MFVSFRVVPPKTILPPTVFPLRDYWTSCSTMQLQAVFLPDHSLGSISLLSVPSSFPHTITVDYEWILLISVERWKQNWDILTMEHNLISKVDLCLANWVAIPSQTQGWNCYYIQSRENFWINFIPNCHSDVVETLLLGTLSCKNGNRNVVIS